jgi:hypothetical protein
VGPAIHPDTDGVRLRALLVAVLLSCACARGQATRTPTSGATLIGPGPSAPEGEFSMAYGARTIQVFAAPSLAPEVDRLFLLLEDLRAESVEISPNTHLPIGWTTLTFTDDGERLTVREPNYDHDPEAETRPDISVSLAVLARQRKVLEQAGAVGEPLNFDQHVLIVVGVLERPNVMAYRVESPGGRMTGWRIVPSEGLAEADEVESLPVYELLRRRPELLDALLLPPGYVALYAGDQLTTLVDDNDMIVWDWTVDGALPRNHDEQLDVRPSTPRPRAQPLLPPIE